MKYAMLGFAGIAFLVGIFLIINTFSMLVAQRTREIGLMRAIGSCRRQVNRSVLVEALLLGVFGSVLGVGAGVGIAVGLMKLMGSMGMNLSTDDLTVAWTHPGGRPRSSASSSPSSPPTCPPGGPARSPRWPRCATPAPRRTPRAGRVRAVLGTAADRRRRLRPLRRRPHAGRASRGARCGSGLGVVLTLIGFVVIGPLLASGVVRVLGAVLLRAFGPVGRMAERNALRNPRRTGATGAALMIGLALVACLSVVGSSMVASATDQLDKTVGTDFIIQSDSGQLDHARGRQGRQVGAGAGTGHRVQGDRGRLHHTRRQDAQGHRHHGGRPDLRDGPAHQDVAGKLADAYKPDSMSVHEKFAEDHGIQLGSKIKVDFKDGSTAG